ncbi:outer membrane beta-barrel protein [Flavilitoribacter nigricans]|uniref:Outer membrane protein beta-barrel domain-containing protein n=1 Tax=Flavilitoribacter nigricans (strain ATCC 23147 / DSM 23189 / NBRC 102662 / NCIMB 1420 / SS-2) TaxID=1122177 RepID=A0A2D0N0U8_FLAN2|nr:outer membrane beta-barrel protein [Flavilitoribacter nigricans]PHN01769.1 hypothetical protein CRP01_35370 [Flavilitoribacter nigricans DSM 23189 = NBRC 102662]
MLRVTLMFFLLFIVSGHFLTAQSRVGVRLGLQISEVKPYGFVNIGNNLIDRYRSPMNRYLVGVTANHTLGKRVSLDTDVIYSRKGFFVPVYRPASFSLDYLSFPIILNAQFLDGPVDLLLGLEPGILLSANYKEEELDFDVRDQWTTLDVSANLGVAYRFNPAFRIKFTYGWGLQSVYRTLPAGSKAAQLGNPNQRLRTFQCSVYYYVISKSE